MIESIPKSNIIYIDESGIELTICKERGWGKSGVRIPGKRSGKYYERTNIISGLLNNKSIAPMIFNGSCNTEVFEIWVEKFLISELKPGQVVIMDNVSFHKSAKARKLIESVQCEIIFLPAYSPDLNPIEKFWANMKRWIKDEMHKFRSLYDALTAFFNAPNAI